MAILGLSLDEHGVRYLVRFDARVAHRLPNRSHFHNLSHARGCVEHICVGIHVRRQANARDAFKRFLGESVLLIVPEILEQPIEKLYILHLHRSLEQRLRLSRPFAILLHRAFHAFIERGQVRGR